MPRTWVEDRQRAQEVKLPPGLTYRSPAELALELIDQMLSWEVPRLPVVANSACGNSFEFREQLRQRQFDYVAGAELRTVVWTADPNAVAVPRLARTGRPRRYPPPGRAAGSPEYPYWAPVNPSIILPTIPRTTFSTKPVAYAPHLVRFRWVKFKRWRVPCPLPANFPLA